MNSRKQMIADLLSANKNVQASAIVGNSNAADNSNVGANITPTSNFSSAVAVSRFAAGMSTLIPASAVMGTVVQEDVNGQNVLMNSNLMSTVLSSVHVARRLTLNPATLSLAAGADDSQVDFHCNASGVSLVVLGWVIKINATDTESGVATVTATAQNSMRYLVGADVGSNIDINVSERTAWGPSGSWSLTDINGTGTVVLLSAFPAGNITANPTPVVGLPTYRQYDIRSTTAPEEFTFPAAQVYPTIVAGSGLPAGGIALPYINSSLRLSGTNATVRIYPIVPTASVVNIVNAVLETGNGSDLAGKLAALYSI